MRREIHSMLRGGWTLAVAGLILLTASLGADRAAADSGQHRGWSTVSGIAVPSACGGDAFAIELSGDLEGCWSVFPETYTCEELNGFAWYTEAGREAFEGTLHGAPGSFVTTYTFEATYASGFCSTFDFTAELAGGCDHYVKGKSGAFTGVVGEISFLDVIPGIDTAGAIMPGPYGPTHLLYVGKLNRLGGGDH